MNTNLVYQIKKKIQAIHNNRKQIQNLYFVSFYSINAQVINKRRNDRLFILFQTRRGKKKGKILGSLSEGKKQVVKYTEEKKLMGSYPFGNDTGEQSGEEERDNKGECFGMKEATRSGKGRRWNLCLGHHLLPNFLHRSGEKIFFVDPIIFFHPIFFCYLNGRKYYFLSHNFFLSSFLLIQTEG